MPTITISEDPEDNKYLECAVQGNADYVISSDRHLLDHDGYRGIRICKSYQFFQDNLALNRSQQGPG